MDRGTLAGCGESYRGAPVEALCGVRAGVAAGCCCSPKTDHLCSLKIDQGWTPRERPSAGVYFTGSWPVLMCQKG